ncbi:MAG TPA: hypothetical protein DDW76_10780 [Cyanobacteria bacterium UBA11369]|nr:hypothetical protein [Cyanobacteria bacterium UBA11368]HBE49257.1 hypothetical protein [Cyanobacteria bacterium UBA11369]
MLVTPGGGLELYQFRVETGLNNTMIWQHLVTSDRPHSPKSAGIATTRGYTAVLSFFLPPQRLYTCNTIPQFFSAENKD